MKSISPAELKNMLRLQSDALQLIDVREPEEHKAFNIGGVLIPISEIIDRQELISRSLPVVVYCKKGIRSMIAIQRLEDKYGLENLYNLSGGIEAWMASD